MIIKHFLSVALLFLTLSVHGQGIFFNSYGDAQNDEGMGMLPDHDGSFLLHGSTLSATTGTYDGYIVKTDSNGYLIWTKTYGAANDDRIQSIASTAEGGYIAAGMTEDLNGIEDGLLLKIDSAGNPLWSKKYGGSQDDAFNKLLIAADGGYILGGATSSSGAGGSDLFIVKTDSSGTILWSRVIGGPGADYVNDMYLMSDGGIIVTGAYNDLTPTDGDAILVKLDAAGNVQWTRTYSGNAQERATGVLQASDGGFIVTGFTSSFNFGYYKPFIIRTDAMGNLVSSKMFVGLGQETMFSIAKDQTGYILAGRKQFNADITPFLLKTDTNLNRLWSRAYGIPDRFVAARQLDNGQYVAVGAGGGSNILFARTDSSGSTGCDSMKYSVDYIPLFTVTILTQPSGTGGTASNAILSVGTGGSMASVCTIVPGVPGVSRSVMEVNVYPNPSEGFITIDASVNHYKLEITDAIGAVLFSRLVTTKNFKLDLGNLPSGIYFYTVKKAGQPMKSGKILLD
jgi:hypothetical protein